MMEIREKEMTTPSGSTVNHHLVEVASNVEDVVVAAKSRHTKTSTTGTPGLDISTRVSLKDPDTNEGSDDTGDESDNEDKPPTSTPDKYDGAKLRGKKSRNSKKEQHNQVIRQGRLDDKNLWVELNGGTEFKLIGGVGWTVLEKLSRKAKINGWAAGMQGPRMPIMNAVTAYQAATI
jgi:hypothetical protein